MPLCHETVKRETVLMLYLSKFHANPQTCQQVSLAVAAVTFWQVFDCDKLTPLKIEVGILRHFGTDGSTRAGSLLAIAQQGTVLLDRFRLRDRQR